MRTNDFHDWLTAVCDIVGESEGHEVVLTCPWCGRPKLYANPTRGMFICFRCRERGKAEKLIAEVEGIPLAQARERLRDRTVPDEDDLLRSLGDLVRRTGERAEPVNHPLPEEFIPCYDGDRWRVPRYLDRRDISDDMIIRHGLGFAKDGRYRNRIILPISQGPHVTFLTRLMGKPSKYAWTDKETGDKITPPKYMTPRDAGLSTVLYGLTWARPGCDLLIVEGSFDVMRLIDLRFDAGAILGKRLSLAQARLVVQLAPKSVTFMYDADAYADACLDADALAGQIDTDVTPVYIARPPSGYDPDKLGMEHGRSGIKDALAERELAGSGWAGLEASIDSL